MDKKTLNRYNLNVLNEIETLSISGGGNEDTFADEIGYVIGAIAGWFASDDYYHSNIRPEGGYL